MSTEQIRLSIPLINEGTDVLRPATDVFVGPDSIRVEATGDYDPDSKEWEFPPGSEVRCVAEFRSGRQILVARSRSVISRWAEFGVTSDSPASDVTLARIELPV